MEWNAAARRIRHSLFFAQSVFSAGYFSAVTVASIVGAALAANPAWAGVPAAALLAGMAASASAWGAAMDRFGRRPTMIGGVLLGAAGGAVAGGGVLADSLALYVVGMLALGSSRAAMDLGRYVAGEVHPPSYRARAISTVVMGATVGAVGGPLLVSPMGAAARWLGMEELAGPYGGTVLLVVVTSAILTLGLRPEPKELAREVAQAHPEADRGRRESGSVREALSAPAARVAALTLVVAQAVMVMVMVITSLHMQNQGHGLAAISIVISSHTFGMFAPSLVSGQLADRWGRTPVILLGAAVLSSASALSGRSPQLIPLGVTLFGLGLGWNLCYVGGSTLLADTLNSRERARVQGLTDTMVGLASAIGSLGSGVVFAAVGYSVMGLIGGLIGLLPLAAVLWLRARPSLVPA